MKSRPSPSSRDRSATGFTLTELLVIMIILGVLAGIVVFAVQSLEGSSSATACKADFKTVETAQESYRVQVGTSAITMDQLMATTTGLNGRTVGPWLKDAPSTNHGYMIGIDLTPGPTYGDITAASINPPHGPDDGNADCSFA